MKAVLTLSEAFLESENGLYSEVYTNVYKFDLDDMDPEKFVGFVSKYAHVENLKIISKEFP